MGKHCIRRMDHHCPWINNCVGEKNQKHFIQFLIYVGILSAYAIGLVIWTWWWSDCQDCPKDIRLKQSRILHSILLIMLSVLFGMFVIAIACDQFEAIFTDETLVEQAKKQGPSGRGSPGWPCWLRCVGGGTPSSGSSPVILET